MPRLIIAAGIVGFIFVALGAFGAHVVGETISEEGNAWWATATFYGLVHSVAALAVAVSGKTEFSRAAIAFLIGATIFSGTLYAMAIGAPHALGAVTPLGGLSFLAGWAMIALTAYKNRP